MKKEEIISSGDLELYSLDTLSQGEKVNIDALMLDDDIQDEKLEVEDALYHLAQAGKVDPPSHLKNSILQNVINNDSTSVKNSPSINWQLAASLSITVVSSFLAIWFWNQWKNTEDTLTLALLDKTLMAENSQMVNQELELMKSQLTILTDPSFQKIKLTSVKESSSYVSVVFWNSSNNETYLDLGNLPALSPDEQYQLWSIADGQPINAGLVNLSDMKESLFKMTDITASQAFAITIEPKGGSSIPTLEKMVVMGNT